jgi:hypothetical protein
MCRNLENRFGKSEMSRRGKIYRKLEEEVFRKSLMSRRTKMYRELEKRFGKSKCQEEQKCV